MKQNVAAWERVSRVLVAVLLAVLIFTHVLTGIWVYILGFVALMMLLTGTSGYCPAYKTKKPNTTKEAAAH